MSKMGSNNNKANKINSIIFIHENGKNKCISEKLL